MYNSFIPYIDYCCEDNRTHIYTIIPPVSPPSPPIVSGILPELKRWLKIDEAVCELDSELTTLMNAAILAFEGYTKLTLFNTTFSTKRDCMGQDWLLRRAPIQSISRFEYKKDGVLTAVNPTIYFLHKKIELGFGFIALRYGATFPTDHDKELDSIEIDFIAGLAANFSGIPADIKLALMSTVACMFTNRGDCSDDCSTIAAFGLSKTGKMIADKYKIIDI